MKKRNKIIYWIATIWLSLGMLSTGAMQLFHVKGDGPGSLDSMMQLGYPVYFVTILGICKILGVVTLLIPRFPLLKEWAYAGFFFMMSGAVYTHIAAGNAMTETFPSLLLLILAIVSWYFRPSDRKVVSVNHLKTSMA
jgi:uncharacterized membrane protein YphA (DoxX/SURF4 family)